MLQHVPTSFSKLMYRIFSGVLVVLLTLSLAIPPSFAQLELNLPEPSKVKPISKAYQPVVLKAVTVDPKDPFLFDFLIDKGDSNLEGDALEAETQKLVKYFLAAVTIPESDLWVNLSPYEQDAMVPQTLGITELGKDLLVDDYILKQVTAGLTNPNTETGKKFWTLAYAKAQELYGTTKVPINTFSKVWIVPDHAEILEKDGTAFVAASHLKVFLDEDYLAIKNNLNNKDIGTDKIGAEKAQSINSLSSQIIKEVVLPEIEKEINAGENFSLVRQIYSSAILAAWYKKRLKDSILGQLYADKGKVAGVNSDDFTAGEKIYEQYTQALKTGVYNIIKQDYDLSSQKITQRKYFSGGVKMAPTASTQIIDMSLPDAIRNLSEGAQTAVRQASSTLTDTNKYVKARVQVSPASSAIRVAVDNAMRQQPVSSSSALAKIIEAGTSSRNTSSAPIADRPEVAYALTTLKTVPTSQLLGSLNFADAKLINSEIEVLKSAKDVTPGQLAELAPRTTELLATNPQFTQKVMDSNPDMRQMRVWTQLASIPVKDLNQRLDRGDLKGINDTDKRTIQMAHAAIQNAAQGQDLSRILNIVATNVQPQITASLSRTLNNAFVREDGNTTTLADQMLSDFEKSRTLEQARVFSTVQAIPSQIPETQIYLRDNLPEPDRQVAVRELAAISNLGQSPSVVEIARVAPTLVRYMSDPMTADRFAKSASINTTSADDAQALLGFAQHRASDIDLELRDQGYSPEVIGKVTAAQIELQKKIQQSPELISDAPALTRAVPQVQAVLGAYPALKEYFVTQSPSVREVSTYQNLAVMTEAELNSRLQPLNVTASDTAVITRAREDIIRGMDADVNFESNPQLKKNSLVVAATVNKETALAVRDLIRQRPEIATAIIKPVLPVVAAAQQLAAFRLITDLPEVELVKLFDKMETQNPGAMSSIDRTAILQQKRVITTDHTQLSLFDKAHFAPAIMAFVSNRERAQQLVSVSTASAPAITTMDRVLGIQGFRQFSIGQMTDHLLNTGFAADNASQVAAAIRQVGEKPNAIPVILNPITLAREVSKNLQSQGITGTTADEYANQIASGSFLVGLATAHESSLLQRNALAERQLTDTQLSQAIQEKGNVSVEDIPRLIIDIKSIQAENSDLFRDASALAQQHPMVNSLIDHGVFDQVARQGQTPQAVLETVGAPTIAEVMVNALSDKERDNVGLTTPRPSFDTAATKRAYDSRMRQLARDVKKVIADPTVLSNRERLAALPVFSEIYKKSTVRIMLAEMLGTASGDRQGRSGGVNSASSGINYIRGIFAPNVTEAKMRYSVEQTLKTSPNFKSNVERGFLVDDLIQIKEKAREDIAFAEKIATANNIDQLQAAVRAANIPVSPSFNKLTDQDVKKLGGIDLSADKMDLQIKRDGNGVPLSFPLQDVGNIKIEGLSPVILDMQPATPQNTQYLMNLSSTNKN